MELGSGRRWSCWGFFLIRLSAILRTFPFLCFCSKNHSNFLTFHSLLLLRHPQASLPTSNYHRGLLWISKASTFFHVSYSIFLQDYSMHLLLLYSLSILFITYSFISIEKWCQWFAGRAQTHLLWRWKHLSPDGPLSVWSSLLPKIFSFFFHIYWRNLIPRHKDILLLP